MAMRVTGSTGHDYYAQVEADAKEFLEGIMASAPSTEGLEVEWVAVPGNPSEVLIAASKGATMLVVGSRGVGGFHGSTHGLGLDAVRAPLPLPGAGRARESLIDLLTAGVNWVVVSSLATAGGTLILAGATFASVRSGNRSARVAEESLLAGMRPLLLPSRPTDEPIKVTFVDNYFALTPGGGATAEATPGAIYLTMSIRNVGSGIAVLHGWRIELREEPQFFERPDVASFAA